MNFGRKNQPDITAYDASFPTAAAGATVYRVVIKSIMRVLFCISTFTCSQVLEEDDYIV